MPPRLCAEFEWQVSIPGDTKVPEPWRLFRTPIIAKDAMPVRRLWRLTFIF